MSKKNIFRNLNQATTDKNKTTVAQMIKDGLIDAQKRKLVKAREDFTKYTDK